MFTQESFDNHRDVIGFSASPINDGFMLCPVQDLSLRRQGAGGRGAGEQGSRGQGERGFPGFCTDAGIIIN